MVVDVRKWNAWYMVCHSHWNSQNSGQSLKKNIWSSWEFCMCAVLYYNVYYLRKMHQNTVFAVLCLCRKLIYYYENLRKLLPTELLLLAQICNKLFVGWGFGPNPTGEAYSAPPDPKLAQAWGPRVRGRMEGVAKGWGWDLIWKEGKEGEGEGEKGIRGEAGHPRFSDGLTPLLCKRTCPLM